MKSSYLLSLAICLALAVTTPAQTYDTNNIAVQTHAGSGFYGHYDGQGVLTMFNAPMAITADTSGNLFVYDSGSALIRKITPSGTVSTFVGGGNSSPPGYGTNVSIPSGYYGGRLTMDHSNTLWLIAGGGLLRITPNGFVVQQATGMDYAGGVCVDSANNIYFTRELRIFRYNPSSGELEVFAGSGNSGSRDGNWIFSSFNNPTALAVDAADNIYVWDADNRLIRRINQSRDVVTIAGTNNIYCYNCDADGVGFGASFSKVNALCVDRDGNLLLTCGTSIRKISVATNVMTLAGSFTESGYADGPGPEAKFKNAYGICAVQDSIFITDFEDHRIRRISFDQEVEAVAPANLGLRMLPGLSITGIVGRTYRIESCTTLSNWTSEATILLTTSPQTWIDQGETTPNKFYRALLLP